MAHQIPEQEALADEPIIDERHYVCRLPILSFDASFLSAVLALAIILGSFVVAHRFDLKALPPVGMVASILTYGILPLVIRWTSAVTEFRPDGITQLSKRREVHFAWSDIQSIRWSRSMLGPMVHRLELSRGRAILLPPDANPVCRDVLSLVGAMRPDVWHAFLFTCPNGRPEPDYPLDLRSRTVLSPAMVFASVLVIAGFVAMVWYTEPDLALLFAAFFYPFFALCLVAIEIADRLTRRSFIFDDVITVKRGGRARSYGLDDYHGHRAKTDRSGVVELEFFLAKKAFRWRVPWRESAMRIHFRLMEMYEASDTIESRAMVR